MAKVITLVLVLRHSIETRSKHPCPPLWYKLSFHAGTERDAGEQEKKETGGGGQCEPRDNIAEQENEVWRKRQEK